MKELLDLRQEMLNKIDEQRNQQGYVSEDLLWLYDYLNQYILNLKMYYDKELEK